MRDGDRGHWLPFLEWMITTSCDLACPGCDRFIEYNHNWTENYEDLVKNMEQWSRHLDPDNFTIIGGEPLIHPRIDDIVRTVRRVFDHATIEIFTNGFLLKKRKDLIDTLLELGNCKIHVSYHNSNPEVIEYLDTQVEKYILKNRPWYQVDRKTWKYKDVEFSKGNATLGNEWYDYRKTVNGVLKPWDEGKPEISYANCDVNVIPIIYNNRLYKCPPISMVRTHLEKFNMTEDPDWRPYYNYKGLGLDCTEEELEDFIDNIKKPHAICNMCPANPNKKPQQEAIIKHRMLK